MPICPSIQSDFEKKLIKKNTLTFESFNYKVINVPAETTKLKGGIHCLVNVLE
jgi:hypothetical protein